MIWALASPERLEPAGREVIADDANVIYVSAVSISEIAIKHALGRSSDPPFSGRDATRFCTEAGSRFLDVTPKHAGAVETLPPIHADPFDRLIIAQASLESMRLLTRDAAILAYGDSMMRV